MRGIFKPEKRVCLRRRLKIGLLIAAIFAAGFCLGMSRSLLWSYSTESADGGRMINFNTGSVADRKKHLDEIYTLGGVPSDFKLNISDYANHYTMKIWSDKPENGRFIYYSQCVAAAYKDAFYPEGTKITMVQDGGIQYMIGEFGETADYTTVVWYQHGYVFFLSGNLPKEEYLNLAKTLKIEDTQ
ncbi:protein of unknown function [Ruminococcaceae bacterium FB2012]|nr:protein of unknown function [Ruminococcaceae bacterium FB2012]